MFTFIEATQFTARVHGYLDDDEYAALQWALAIRPDTGAIVRGSGGLRKLRWRAQGRGKSGGYRVIYYWRARAGEIWLLTIYAKSEEQSIPAHVLRALKEEVEE
jgi:mRNA-degrading endonuclease RelE of RelBE toxin-antitoxin system